MMGNFESRTPVALARQSCRHSTYLQNKMGFKFVFASIDSLGENHLVLLTTKRLMKREVVKRR
jgi:hypothetical protein